MEQTPCPLSGTTAFTPFLQVPDRFDPSGKVLWQLVRSTASGLVMLNPRPESTEMAVHYHRGSYDPHLQAGTGSSPAQRAYLAARKLLTGYRASFVLKGAPAPPQGLSILEIGCSTGELLRHLHRIKGIPKEQLYGVEPESNAAEYARNSFGLHIAQSIEDIRLKNRLFDRIVLWHTLEHIHDLHETVAFAGERLQEDGMLVLALPNPESHDARHYKENWIAWDAPRHLYHFVPKTVEKLLEQHHLELVTCQPYLPDSLYNSINSEKLRCTREKHRFTLPKMGAALLQATAAVATGMLQPLKASSIVYFVRKKRKT
ncbi:MAG: class I SAM-dependent methyltransferase [Chlorobiaceae bacterium]|nr:class I SAM-dependent methyltransferase [Chlorobiaceae bacterium]